jgi:hypothetical protein
MFAAVRRFVRGAVLNVGVVAELFGFLSSRQLVWLLPLVVLLMLLAIVVALTSVPVIGPLIYPLF